MIVLQVENITAGYRNRPVLQNISLTVQNGEILAVLGENGSGKTTLLRAIQGNIPLQAGRITLNGTDLSFLDTRKRAALVTTMSQDIRAEAGLTGQDRIEMGMFPQKGVFGRITEEDSAKIRSMAGIYGILPLLDRDLSAMSTGERQMISLLRAVVQDTPVLLLDEPASALDFNKTEELLTMLKQLAARGKIILIVLHDPTQALRISTKLLQMDKNGGSPKLLDLQKDGLDQVEASLRSLYPKLRIHNDPVFCYTEEYHKTIMNKTIKKGKNYADN